jgi:hypothetical protein
VQPFSTTKKYCPRMHEDSYRETSLLVGCVSMAVLWWRFDRLLFLLLFLFSLMSLEIKLGYQSLKKPCYFVLLSNLVLFFLILFLIDFFSILSLIILFHLIFILNLVIILLIVISFDLDHSLNWIFFQFHPSYFCFILFLCQIWSSFFWLLVLDPF